MSDFEQWSLLKLDLISRLVNMSYELEPIMARYDFLEDRRVNLSNVNFSYDLGRIMIR